MSEIVHRIGLLVPSSDGVTEADFKNLLPRNVSFHTGRLYHSDSTPRGAPTLDEIVGQTEAAIRSIEQVDPELVVFACTSASFYKGLGWDRQIAERIRAAAGVPAIVTTTAVTDALRTVGAKQIYMVTPYPEAINRIELKFFHDSGIEITGYTHFECVKSKEISDILPAQIIERVLSVRKDIEGCDALLISCTGLRGADTVATLEPELGMPVITSNVATVWATVRALGLSTAKIPGGRICATAAAPASMLA
jgi:maleate isomerase